MNELKIEIPDNKEIDWEASVRQKQIVLKDKQLTYKDMCQELFKNGYCYMDMCGNTKADGYNEIYLDNPNNARTRHQLECILSKNKLANVARYLNGEWDYYKSSDKFIIWINTHDNNKLYIDDSISLMQRATVIFKSVEAAQQAIEILGEETVKLALEPLY